MDTHREKNISCSQIPEGWIAHLTNPCGRAPQEDERHQTTYTHTHNLGLSQPALPYSLPYPIPIDVHRKFKIPTPFLLETNRSFHKTSTPHPQPQHQSHTQQTTLSNTLTITITIIIVSTPITYHDAGFLFFLSSSSVPFHFPVPISLHTGCAHRQVLEMTKFFQA